ncbi:MAG: uncharacterized protein KVP18_000405 [Porospora cf. gigantea A]|uniref:uncharacterized protein n=1 Tax=Porospora cf. gigantea A TaxID=2853593 RepID=UPI00355AA549|nr:MAG: hypothetical protein KVP18_000405 [Porospora cf. gigantea A]
MDCCGGHEVQALVISRRNRSFGYGLSHISMVLQSCCPLKCIFLFVCTKSESTPVVDDNLIYLLDLVQVGDTLSLRSDGLRCLEADGWSSPLKPAYDVLRGTPALNVRGDFFQQEVLMSHWQFAQKMYPDLLGDLLSDPMSEPQTSISRVYLLDEKSDVDCAFKIARGNSSFEGRFAPSVLPRLPTRECFLLRRLKASTAHYPSLYSIRMLPDDTEVSVVASVYEASTHPYLTATVRQLSMNIMLVDQSIPQEIHKTTWFELTAETHRDLPVLTAGDTFRIRRAIVKRNRRGNVLFVDLEPSFTTSVRMWSGGPQPSLLDLPVRQAGFVFPPNDVLPIPAVGHVIWRTTHGGRELETQWSLDDQMRVTSAIQWMRGILQKQCLYHPLSPVVRTLKELFRRSTTAHMRQAVQLYRCAEGLFSEPLWRSDTCLSNAHLFGDVVVKTVDIIELPAGSTLSGLHLTDLYGKLPKLPILRELVKVATPDPPAVLSLASDLFGEESSYDKPESIPALSRLSPRQYVTHWASEVPELTLYPETPIIVLVTDGSLGRTDRDTRWDCFGLLGLTPDMLSYLHKPPQTISEASCVPRTEPTCLRVGDWLRLRNVTLSDTVVQMSDEEGPFLVPCIEVYFRRSASCEGRMGKGINLLPAHSHDVAIREAALSAASTMRYSAPPAADEATPHVADEATPHVVAPTDPATVADVNSPHSYDRSHVSAASHISIDSDTPSPAYLHDRGTDARSLDSLSQIDRRQDVESPTSRFEIAPDPPLSIPKERIFGPPPELVPPPMLNLSAIADPGFVAPPAPVQSPAGEVPVTAHPSRPKRSRRPSSNIIWYSPS